MAYRLAASNPALLMFSRLQHVCTSIVNNVILPHSNARYCSALPYWSQDGHLNKSQDAAASEIKNVKSSADKTWSQAELDIPKETDYVIIGGGSFGLSTAYWLKKYNPEGFTLTVIERDPTHSRAATTLSVGSIRQQFSLPENIQLSLFSADFLLNIREHLSVLDLDPPDIQFHQQGYLLLSQDQHGSKILERNYETQKELGAKTVLLDSNSLKAKFPWLNTAGLQQGSYGLANEGWFDPWLYLTALKVKCVSLGVRFVKGEVTGFTAGDTSTTTEDGDGINQRKALDTVEIKADDGKTYSMKFSVSVNCAGPWSGQVSALAGIGKAESGVMAVPLPVEPRKRYVYVVHCPDGPGPNMPMLIDPLGVYVRREGVGGCYICGASPKADEEPKTADLDVDYTYFEEKIWPVLAHRIPLFEKLKLKSAWAGFYDYNYFDQNLIIGRHPYHRNFLMATGCSGHGVQQSPAIGRAMAEYILHGTYTTIDLSRFSFDRVILNEPLFEEGPYII